MHGFSANAVHWTVILLLATNQQGESSVPGVGMNRRAAPAMPNRGKAPATNPGKGNGPPSVNPGKGHQPKTTIATTLLPNTPRRTTVAPTTAKTTTLPPTTTRPTARPTMGTTARTRIPLASTPTTTASATTQSTTVTIKPPTATTASTSTTPMTPPNVKGTPPAPTTQSTLSTATNAMPTTGTATAASVPPTTTTAGILTAASSTAPTLSMTSTTTATAVTAATSTTLGGSSTLPGTTTATAAATTASAQTTQPAATTTPKPADVCTQPVTAGSRNCYCWGDPHCASFDGTWNHYQGTCKLEFATCKATGFDSFRIFTKSEPWSAFPSKSLIDMVEMHVGSNVIVLYNNDSITINGATFSAGTGSPDLIVAFGGSTGGSSCTSVDEFGQVTVRTSFGLMVAWSPGFPVALNVVVPPAYEGGCTGLCGPWNNNPTDDLTTKSGTVTTSIDTFGDSWKQDPTCVNAPGISSADPWVNAALSTTTTAESECGPLRSLTGPYKDCLVIPEMVTHAQGLYESCKYDVCAAMTAGQDPRPWSCQAKEVLRDLCKQRTFACIDYKFFPTCCPYTPSLCAGADCSTCVGWNQPCTQISTCCPQGTVRPKCAASGQCSCIQRDHICGSNADCCSNDCNSITQACQCGGVGTICYLGSIGACCPPYSCKAAAIAIQNGLLATGFCAL